MELLLGLFIRLARGVRASGALTSLQRACSALVLRTAETLRCLFSMRNLGTLRKHA